MSRSRDEVAEELLQLSRKLKLTDRQTRFVMALTADPERNQFRAASDAGISPKAAGPWAWKTLRLGKVQEFLGKVQAEVTKRAEEKERAELAKAAAPLSVAIMEAAEHQQRLSMIARADIGKHLVIDADGRATIKLDPAHTGIIREVVTKELFGGDEQQGVVLETRIKVADPLPALVALGRVRGWEKSDLPGQEAGAQALAILGAASVEGFKSAFLKLIAGNGAGGNGAHR